MLNDYKLGESKSFFELGKLTNSSDLEMHFKILVSTQMKEIILVYRSMFQLSIIKCKM